MAPRHVVVDGSNIATEGRSMPSLAQLDQAVREFLMENPDDVVTVVVDASFGHRIDGSESEVYEEAEAAAELISPPAGAIGRGDAFLLRIADKTGATVLSNDSFQEFHGDYDWLFERGRLIGGKPVPGVGWIFTLRTPVRGPRSREAVKEARRKTTTRRPGDDAESAMPGLDLAAERARGKGKGKKTVERAIAVALEEAVTPSDKRRRPRKAGSPPAQPLNDPLAFITFIAAHPLGTEVTATVDSFASHGAFVECEGARCYVPLSGMGDPPPKSAREVLSRGEVATFVVQALDPQRRGVELAVPGFAKIAGAPTEETVAAEIEARADEPATSVPAPKGPKATTKKKSKAAAKGGGVADAVPTGTVAEPTTQVEPARRHRKRVPAADALDVAPAEDPGQDEPEVAGRRRAPATVTPAGTAEEAVVRNGRRTRDPTAATDLAEAVATESGSSPIKTPIRSQKKAAKAPEPSSSRPVPPDERAAPPKRAGRAQKAALAAHAEGPCEPAAAPSAAPGRRKSMPATKGRGRSSPPVPAAGVPPNS